MDDPAPMETDLWLPKGIENLPPAHYTMVERAVGYTALTDALKWASLREAETVNPIEKDDVYVSADEFRQHARETNLPLNIFGHAWGRIHSRFLLALALTPRPQIENIDHASP